MRPLTWLLAAPRVVAPGQPLPQGPLLIVANHVTDLRRRPDAYMRCRAGAATHRRGHGGRDARGFPPLGAIPSGRRDTRASISSGRPIYWLVTALFNVFPLPRQRDFQASFAHAGKAMDHGYNVLVFPEGRESVEGKLAALPARHRALAKQSGAPVLPVALRGLGELKTRRRWFRSGKIEIHVGEAIRFGPEETEAAITARLHDEVERLLEEQ